METSNMKNMVVLKNLPSNLVEEAIVILKSSKKVKKLETIEKSNQPNNKSNEKKQKDYVLKEAEMLVSNYISKIENGQKQKQSITAKNSKKYRKLKKYAYLSTSIIMIEAILLLIK